MLKYYMTRLPQSPMTIAGWPEIDGIRRQLEQVFTELTHDTPVRIPAIELSHTAETIVLTAELPGIASDDLDIEVTRDRVSLKGTDHSSPNESAQVYHSERRMGNFQRVISLPIAVDNQNATATFEYGVLTLTLPKLKVVAPSSVKVTIAGNHDPAVASTAPIVAETVEPTKSDAWQ